MDPKLTPEERKMQEEILQYDFPFDEKAWSSMDALLDRNKQKPEASTPPKPKDVMPGPSWKLGLLLTLLCTCSIGAASLYWFNLKSRTLLPSNTSLVQSEATAKANEQKQEQVASPGNETVLTQLENTQDQKRLNTQEQTTVQSSRLEQSLQSKQGKSAFYASELLKSSNTSQSASSATNQAIGKSPSNQFSNTTGISTSNSETDPLVIPKEPAQMPEAVYGATSETNLETITQIDASLLPIPALEKVEYVQTYLQPDSIIQPLKRKPVITARKEQGWIFGINANTVDNNPLRLSVLPHVGFFKSYRLKPGLMIQGDLMLKYVTGYQWHVEFIDIIPGGSSHNIVDINNLLYLELPIFLKYQYRPKCSIIGGLKPSGNLKLFSSGLNSQFNDSGGRYLDGQSSARYFDLGLVMGWEWRFSRHWALDIRYNQGLLDLTHDQYFKDSSTHLNSDLQVSMRYALSKKIRRHVPKALFPPPVGQ